ITSLSKFNEAVPQELIDNLEVVKAGIIENDYIFNGPLYSNKDELKVEEGAALTDGEKLSIQWFVKGVKGKIPEAK
ncbi:MAG: BMP family ABC transporter substrate-binding protein, partial [Candidatus Delongbacteria bacterium]|nr:BMP family ABC transporter substrate-binding protein [Candidatus Delongbacteria bacterium]